MIVIIIEKEELSHLINFLLEEKTEKKEKEETKEKEVAERHKTEKLQEKEKPKKPNNIPKAERNVTRNKVLEILKQKEEDFFTKPYPQMAKEIAKEMGLSKSTIYYHFKRLLPEIKNLQQQKQQQQKKEKEPLIDPEDAYRPIVNVNTRCDYDGSKIEGTLEG